MDGSLLIARVPAVDGAWITLATPRGVEIDVERSEVRSVRAARGRLVEGAFWREDANSSRLFFTATGRSLEAGQGYVGTYLVVLPFAMVGVTDRRQRGFPRPRLRVRR